MNHIHTFPIPDGYTPQDAWAEICTIGHLATDEPIAGWASIECDGVECGGVERTFWCRVKDWFRCR